MGLPASGQISINQINLELGYAGDRNIWLDHDQLRTLAGKAGSGTGISLDDFHNKSAYTPMTVTRIDDSSVYDSAFAGGTATVRPSVSVTGGSGGYTYAWSIVSSSGYAPALGNATSAQCQLTRTFGRNTTGNFVTTLQCIVTDNTGHTSTRSDIVGQADWSPA